MSASESNVAAPVVALDAEAEEALCERARALHASCLVGDIHTHVLLPAGYLGIGLKRPHRPAGRWSPLKHFADPVTIERAIEGGVGLLVLVVYVFGTPWGGYRRATWRMIDRFHALLRRHEDRVGHARSVAEVHRLRAEGKLACMLAVEGGHSLERDLGQLERLRREGVTYLTLTHFVDNLLSGAAMHPGSDRGLTGLGREAVREANRVGILVDVTHCTKRAVAEAMDVSTQPVIFSHTGLDRFVRKERMTTDAELAKVREQGGIVGQMLSPFFVNGSVLRASADDAARSIAYAIERAGDRAACVGSDLCSGLPPLSDMPHIGHYEVLTRALLRAGLSDEQVRRVWSANFLDLLTRCGW